MKADTSVYDIDDVNLSSPFENFSFFNYLYSETTTTDVEREASIYKTRKKRVFSFLLIPIQLEYFLFYASLICIDHFLWLYTFLPIRCLLLPVRALQRLITRHRDDRGPLLVNEEVQDVMRLSFMLLLSFCMCQLDTSVIYHEIRSQSVIKLYIFFNLLEVADRLLSPLCQDIVDALSWTIAKAEKQRCHWCSFFGQYVLAALCFLIHLIVMISQTTILNVAFNSHNNAILTVMLSNNFIELKGNVFRKVETNNLLQMSCADSRERFHYVVMLSLVIFRNLTEIGWSTAEFYSMFELFCWIIFAEVFVDWIKHAFVTKFNFISGDVYRTFSVSLAYDFILCRTGKNSSSLFELMGRRMGLTSIPLACLVNVFLLKSLRTWSDRKWLLPLLFCMFVVKIGANLLLLSRSYREVDRYLEAAAASQAPARPEPSEQAAGDVKADLQGRAAAVHRPSRAKSEYELVLPSLPSWVTSRGAGLKRTASFSEGVRQRRCGQRQDDENDNSDDGRDSNHRGSLGDVMDPQPPSPDQPISMTTSVEPRRYRVFSSVEEDPAVLTTVSRTSSAGSQREVPVCPDEELAYERGSCHDNDTTCLATTDAVALCAISRSEPIMMDHSQTAHGVTAEVIMTASSVSQLPLRLPESSSCLDLLPSNNQIPTDASADTSSQPRLLGDQQQPLSDVNRFSMYSNHIV